FWYPMSDCGVFVGCNVLDDESDHFLLHLVAKASFEPVKRSSFPAVSMAFRFASFSEDVPRDQERASVLCHSRKRQILAGWSRKMASWDLPFTVCGALLIKSDLDKSASRH
ncbi:hypothetical protein, partial [Serratia fonticola]